MNIVSIIASGGAIVREWADGGTIVLQWIGILALVLLNGFFVAAEFALVKVRSSQLEALEQEGNRRVIQTKKALTHLDAYLSATQLGITLTSLGLGWVGEPFLAAMLEPLFLKIGIAESMIHPSSFAIAFSIITFLHIVLGELAPKSLAIRKSVGTSLFVAAPLGWFYTVFKPAIWFLNGAANKLLKYLFRIEPASEHELAHSEEELRVILAESAKAREVSPLGKELLINALDLRERVVRDIHTPRGSVIFLNTEDSFAENVKRAEESRHTRFPLCRGHLDDTLGLVHIKDLLKLLREGGTPNLESIRRELQTVPEMMPLEKLLNFFLKSHSHIALVVDEYGGAVGIVTLDNVLEEIVGEIQDEFDTEQPELRKVTQDEFLVEGSLGLYELNDMLSLELESSEVSTVGGYITQLIGHLPVVGERTRVEDFEATVTKSDGRRVIEVNFKRVKS
ncbi:MAG: hypothetical protein RL088_2438 [Verrucomicrobiota bacterium]|jgi:CBS domain containing-hemolysin-like protein